MARAIVPAADEIVDRYFPVLDHGFIALVDYMGDDLAIIDAARTSYGLGTKAVSEDRSLGRYLYRHRHTTPIEMLELKFHCKMPIFVARQWIRHRTANINEYSGRYSLMPMQFYTPKREQVATQSTSNKQGRSDNLLELEEYDNFVDELQDARVVTQRNYEEFVRDYGIARELARLDLPLSLYTEWYWKIDGHNLAHFLGQRCHSHAQWEVRQYANIMAGMLQRVAPDLTESWIDYHPNMGGVLLSRQEIELLRTMLGAYQRPMHSGENAAIESGVGCLVDEFHEPKEVPFGAMQAAGMSKREVQAFMDLFNPQKPRPVPKFELDLSVTRDAAYFEEQKNLHTPDVDKAP